MVMQIINVQGSQTCPIDLESRWVAKKSCHVCPITPASICPSTRPIWPRNGRDTCNFLYARGNTCYMCNGQFPSETKPWRSLAMNTSSVTNHLGKYGHQVCLGFVESPLHVATCTIRLLCCCDLLVLGNLRIN